jgi:Ni/Co efflux regulator RcnB
MSKLLSTLIAAAFAVTTFGAAAQTPPAKGDAPKADTQKAEKKAKSDKSKAEKKAKADKSKADKKAKGDGKKAKGDGKKAKGDGKKAKGDGKKSEKATAPQKEEAQK